MDAVNPQQLLVLHDVIVLMPPAPATMAWKTCLLDLDQRHFQGQIGVRKHGCKIDQFVEDVQHRALLGTEPAAHDAATGRVEPDDMFAGDDGLHHQDAVVLD